MKKNHNIKKAIGVAVIMGLVFYCTIIFTLTAYAVATTPNPQTAQEIFAHNSQSFSLEYKELYYAIANDENVPVWEIEVFCENHYGVITDENGMQIHTNNKCVPVYYLRVDGVDKTIYSEEPYIVEEPDIFELEPKVQPAVVSSATYGGYTAEEIAKLYDEWIECASNDMFVTYHK